jgi:hypothetical protein
MEIPRENTGLGRLFQVNFAPGAALQAPAQGQKKLPQVSPGELKEAIQPVAQHK